MKSYRIKHILPRKAGLISLGCLLPFLALGLFLESEMDGDRSLASFSFVIGITLASYFVMFYVEGVKVIQLSTDAIIANGKVIKIESISSFKLKDDNPEFIYLKIIENNGQKLSIGTRTSDKVELLKLYEDVKEATQKHNKDSINKITEGKSIYDGPLGRVIGITVIILMLITIHHQFFTDDSTKKLSGFIVMLSCGTFLISRIFGKNNNR